MHMHEAYNGGMRTTIEMRPEHRSRLLELAASRGEKGFSSVVAEALDLYLETHAARAAAIERALALKGCLSEAEADELSAGVSAIRENWR